MTVSRAVSTPNMIVSAAWSPPASERCLICNARLAFDAASGEGVTVEHIRERSRGGTDDPRNLALAHAACNGEKGRNWDHRKKRSDAEYDLLMTRLQVCREARWCAPLSGVA